MKNENGKTGTIRRILLIISQNLPECCSDLALVMKKRDVLLLLTEMISALMRKV